MKILRIQDNSSVCTLYSGKVLYNYAPMFHLFTFVNIMLVNKNLKLIFGFCELFLNCKKWESRFLCELFLSPPVDSNNINNGSVQLLLRCNMQLVMWLVSTPVSHVCS